MKWPHRYDDLMTTILNPRPGPPKTTTLKPMCRLAMECEEVPVSVMVARFQGLTRVMENHITIQSTEYAPMGTQLDWIFRAYDSMADTRDHILATSNRLARTIANTRLNSHLRTPTVMAARLSLRPNACTTHAFHCHTEQAIVRAANDTKDNDTVAAIVGTAVVALHGRTALPQHWIPDLLGSQEPMMMDMCLNSSCPLGSDSGLRDRATQN